MTYPFSKVKQLFLMKPLFVSKIGTHLDQVVDDFYVTNQAGQKITDEKLLQEIRAQLLSAIEGMGTA